MATIKAAHYGETEARLLEDPIVIELASEIPWNELNDRFLNNDMEPNFDFMMRANDAYASRGGKDGGHIGAIANAIVALVCVEDCEL